MVLTGFLSTSNLEAKTIYVDNVQGDDIYDGGAKEPSSTSTGPVRSIGKALRLARFGDTISIANNGVPYVESLSLVGMKHSGDKYLPFTIEGNGALVQGSQPVHPLAWELVGATLWKITPRLKSHAMLLSDGKQLPEIKPSNTTTMIPEIPAGSWASWQGSIYYQARPKEDVRTIPFEIPVYRVGLSLYRTCHVRISNLQFQHFQLDGILLFDQNEEVFLDRMISTQNGRAGLTVSGTSKATISQSQIEQNRDEQIRVRGTAKLLESSEDNAAPATDDNSP